MVDYVYVTAEGLAKMQEELRERKEVRRVEIAERLESAIKMGDLSENADYHTAKEDQAFNEGRIRDLEDQLWRVQVIISNKTAKTVQLGSQVTIMELDGEDFEESYQIVGAQEADPPQGRISNESPIGRALLGARPGDVVSAETPAGRLRFKVLHIHQAGGSS